MVAYAMILDQYTFAFSLKETQSLGDISTILKLGKSSESPQDSLSGLLVTTGNPWCEVASHSRRHLVGYSGPQSADAADPSTVYFDGFDDIFDAEATLGFLRSVTSDTKVVDFSIAPSPEETLSVGAVFLRYLRDNSSQRGTRSTNPYVLAVTSKCPGTLQLLREEAKSLASRFNSKFSQKVCGILLLETVVAHPLCPSSATIPDLPRLGPGLQF